jgi:hypothetical protein
LETQKQLQQLHTWTQTSDTPPKAWDPVEPFAKTNKYFGTTPSPDSRSIKKRMSTNKFLGLFNFRRERRSTLTEQQQSKLPTVLAENQRRKITILKRPMKTHLIKL